MKGHGAIRGRKGLKMLDDLSISPKNSDENNNSAHKFYEDPRFQQQIMQIASKYPLSPYDPEGNNNNGNLFGYGLEEYGIEVNDGPQCENFKDFTKKPNKNNVKLPPLNHKFPLSQRNHLEQIQEDPEQYEETSKDMIPVTVLEMSRVLKQRLYQV